MEAEIVEAMKLGGLLTAVGVLAILGGTVWWTNKHPTVDAKSKTPDAPKILSLDPKQITDIRIAKDRLRSDRTG